MEGNMKRKSLSVVLSVIFVFSLIIPVVAIAAGTGGGNCISLGGSGECVSIGSLDATSSFTFEMWANFTDDVFDLFNPLISYGNYHPHFELYSGRPQLRDAAACSSYMPRNTWTHLAVTYQGSSPYTSIIYVNGKLWGSSTNQITTDGEGMTIGHDVPQNYTAFYGQIDEVRIWNTALDQETIRAWMNKDLNSSHPNVSDDVDNNLIGYWKFDEASGTTAGDFSDDISSATEHEGTLTNTSGDEWILSTVPVGNKSHVGTGSNNLIENADVAVDISWDNDPGSTAIFSAIQIDDTPGVTTGLPGTYPPRYWEVWLAADDGDYQADVSFHFDDIDGITDESAIALYSRSFGGEAWSEVGSYTLHNEGNNTDGTGYITATDLTDFSQFILCDEGGPVNPVPELPALILAGTGIAVLGIYLFFRQN